MTTKADLPKPYSSWWHPEKTWRDILWFKFLSLFLPFSKLTKLPACKDSPETVQFMQELRQGVDKADTSGFRATALRWKTAANCSGIVHVVRDVPHKPNVVKAWGLEDNTPPFDSEVLKGNGKIHVFFPSSLLKEQLRDKEEDSYGCLPADSADWSQFAKDIPILVYLHGGAMCLGGIFNPDGIEPFARMVEEGRGPVILIGVEYRLAPEDPFPAPALDVLSVMDYVLEDAFPNHPVHISGISAGGYYGTVAFMECVRRYGPERIAGAWLSCPCCDPACDTLSYYQSGPSSFVSSDFCRWIWRGYLELSPSKDVHDKVETMDDLLRHNSNRTTWNESKWKNTVWERLIDPRVDLPSDLDKAPKIIMSTFRADPLYSEGKSLVEALRAKKANLEYIDCSGSHWFGLSYEPATEKTAIEAWKNQLWP